MDISGILHELIALDVLIATISGVLVGILVGALPGLTPTLAIALLIPLTYAFDTTAALVMMMAIYTAGIYGGSLSAILLHTPGTPSAAATADDGYALTLQGRGLEAIGISTISSTIGGLVSGFALLAIAPPLARLSLKFGPPEYLFLYLFGLTVIGSLSSGKMLKGMLCALMGLAIATVGSHVSSGYPRYIFGNSYLITGIPMVGVMVGLFSVSQVMVQAEELRKGSSMGLSNVTSSLSGKMLPSSKEIMYLLPTIIRSSIIGVLIGILPGASADVGAWVSYNEAKRWSKNKEGFGKGSIEGVCAPETANNAVTGGAIIPLLTLGVPGSATAAVLLGGLLMHGMIPGSQLFTKHGNITYAIIIGFIFSNIVMGAIGIAIARHVSKIASVPTSMLAPIIVVLAVIGCYSMNQRIADVIVMVIFGFIGYFMLKADIPRAPMVLALILGPGVEVNLFQSLLVAKGVPLMEFFFSRPICVIFILFTVAALLTPLISTLKSIKKKRFTREI